MQTVENLGNLKVKMKRNKQIHLGKQTEERGQKKKAK